MSSAIMPAHSENIEKYTPEYIFRRLNTLFDLDPCSPFTYAPSWDFCTLSYKLARGEDGLTLPWVLEDGTSLFIWLNPPWTRGEKRKWVMRLAEHRNGIALVRGGIDSAWLHDSEPDGIYLLRGRVLYVRPDGEPERQRKGGATGGFEPSMLLAFGIPAMDLLANCSLQGRYFQHTSLSTPAS